MRRALLTILVAAPLACGAFGKGGDASAPEGDDDDSMDTERADAGGEAGTTTGPKGDAGTGKRDGGGEGPDDSGPGPVGSFPLHFAFEGTGDCGWLANTTSTKLSLTTNARHDGSTSCQICTTGPASPVAVKSRPFAVKKGHFYDLTGFVGPVGANKPQTTIFLALEPAPAGSFAPDTRGMDSGPWSDFHYSRQVQADAMMTIDLGWAMPESGCVVIDDITIVEQ